MRRNLAALLGAILIGTLMPVTGQARASVNIYVGGGTPLTNGAFFPGTLIYDGSAFTGEPFEVAKGTDLNLVMLDEATVSNTHKMVSFKRNRKTQLPLFQSEVLNRPGDQSLVITSHLKPGLYRYYCSTHDGMFGAIQITG
jgi:hypothetical protein